MTTFTYPLDYYQALFTSERWEEINKVINNWESPTLENGKKLESLIMNPETSLAFYKGNSEQVHDYNWDYWKKQVLVKYVTDEEREMCNKLASSRHCEARDKLIYDSARKVEEADYGAPVFHNDNYYDSIDDLRDMWDYDDPLPEYVFGSDERFSINGCDLENALDNIIERVGTINDEYLDVPKIPEYLQKAWDKFVDEYSHNYYCEDRKTVISLDKTLNHNAEYEATD
jgi:hypothetical protein